MHAIRAASPARRTEFFGQDTFDIFDAPRLPDRFRNDYGKTGAVTTFDTTGAVVVESTFRKHLQEWRTH